MNSIIPEYITEFFSEEISAIATKEKIIPLLQAMIFLKFLTLK